MPLPRSSCRSLVFSLSAIVWLSVHPLRASERPLILQGAPAVAAGLLDPYRDLIASEAQVALIAVVNDAAKGLTTLLEGRADVALIAGDCTADLAEVQSAVSERERADLQIFEIDRLGGDASSFVTLGAPTPQIRRLINAACRVAAAHPF